MLVVADKFYLPKPFKGRLTPLFPFPLSFPLPMCTLWESISPSPLFLIFLVSTQECALQLEQKMTLSDCCQLLKMLQVNECSTKDAFEPVIKV